MGVLTSKERKGLEDVFLSINTKKNQFNIFKHGFDFLNISLKHAKVGVKNTKIYKLSTIFYKKKKTLSK